MKNALTPTPTAPPAKPDYVRRLVEDFFAGRKPTTLRVYRQGLSDFAAFLGTESIEDALRVLLSHGPGEANHLALSYKADMMERGLAPNTINVRLTALRSAVMLARRIGMVVWSLEIDGEKSRVYRDTAGPGLDVCRQMLAEVTRRTHGPPARRTKATRDRAILRLLFDLALRRSSVTALDAEDVDLENRTIQVWAKGANQGEKTSRRLPIPTAEALRVWLDVRGVEPGALFVSLDPRSRGNRLTGSSVWRIVDDLARAVGARVWPHALRHGSVTTVVDESRDIRLGRIQAGHASIATTQVYLDNLKGRALDEEASRIAASALGQR